MPLYSFSDIWFSCSGKEKKEREKGRERERERERSVSIMPKSIHNKCRKNYIQ